jgi:hypothetical protein
VFVLSCFGFQPISFIKSEQFSSAISMRRQIFCPVQKRKENENDDTSKQKENMIG